MIGGSHLNLVIPGLVLSTIWWVAIPVAVVERPGTVASLRRSSELTKGVRWRIFGLFVAYLLVLFGGLSLVGIVLFALIDDIVLADWLWTIVGWVWVAAAMALQAVLVAVSLATKAPDPQRVAPLTVHYHRRPGHVPPRRDLATSAVVIGLVVAAWLYFS